MAYLNSKFLSGFSPQNIPGLAVWLDATDSNSVGQASGVVSNWIDKSPNAYSMSQATAGARPTYETNVQNGRPSLRFTTAQALTSTAGVSLTGQQTWFLSFKPLASGNLFFIEQGPDANSFSGGYFYGGNNYLYYVNRSGTGRYLNDTAGSQYAVGTWYITSVTMSNISNVATDYYYTVNGVARNVTVSTGLPGNTVVSSNLFINPTTRVPGSNYTGELIIYNRALSRGEIQLTERYLANKWGVTLSNTHPYFSVPAALRPFNPLDISGCNLWLDAADFRSFDISSVSNVSRWKDKTGLSNDMTVFIGTPTYSSLSPPRVSLDGGSALQNTTTTNAVYTSFYVFLKSSATGPLFTTSTVASSITGLFPNENGTTYLARSDSAWYSQGSTISNNQSNLVTVQYDSASNAYVWLNGALNLSTTVTGTITRDRLLLGLRAIPNFNYMTGNFYEVIQYDRAISTLERQQVELYLAEKWGLRGNLSSSNALRLYESLSPAFNPTLISNCSLWLDAADYGTLSLTGSTVNTWRDKSGLGYSAAIGAYTSPTYTDDGVRPYVRFGSNQSMRIAGWAYTTGWTVLCAMNTVNLGGTGRWFVSPYDNISLVMMGFVNNKIFATMPAQTDVCGNHIECTAAANTNATALYYYFRDGASITSNSSASAIGDTTVNLGIGANGNGTDPLIANGSVFNLYELVIYNRLLTTQERQLVEGYLAWRWNLAPSILSNNHPYKTIRV